MILPQSQMFAPTPLALFVIAWSLVWKGLALYRAARNQHKYWFVALLILNTVGILDIVYLIFVDKVLMKDWWSRLTNMKRTEAKPAEAPKAEIKQAEKPSSIAKAVEDKENKA